MNTIRACEKIRYGSQDEANAAMKRILLVSDTAKPDHAYLCPYCGNWHLTSMSKKKSKKEERKHHWIKKSLWQKFMK